MIVIFASVIFTIPSFIAGLLDSENAFAVFVTKYVNYTTPVGFIAYLIIIILFCFFYTFLQINPEELSKNLNKNGGYIPGVRPGKETKQYIVVRIGGEKFGIDICYIDNIIRMQKITRVPKVQHYFKGIINLRGEIVPVMSIRKKMGLADDVITDASRIIILKIAEKGSILSAGWTWILKACLFLQMTANLQICFHTQKLMFQKPTELLLDLLLLMKC